MCGGYTFVYLFQILIFYFFFLLQIIVVVDNTFLTSYLQRPLELGADMVAYSLTKYMNGHSDVVMGGVVLNDDDLHDRLRFLQNGKYF